MCSNTRCQRCFPVPCRTAHREWSVYSELTYVMRMRSAHCFSLALGSKHRSWALLSLCSGMFSRRHPCFATSSARSDLPFSTPSSDFCGNCACTCREQLVTPYLFGHSMVYLARRRPRPQELSLGQPGFSQTRLSAHI